MKKNIKTMSISPNEIHLWYSYDEQICNPQLLHRYLCLLNEEERKQQKRFFFEKHRHQYLIVRSLVRTVLSLYVNEISPENWQFGKNKYGKPTIKNSLPTKPLHFNISHSDKLVVLAVTTDYELGVDVEYLHRPGKTVEIAERYFSPIEVQELLKLPAQKQKDRFLNLWTLKEAYIKACGKGLSIPLDQFSFSFREHGEIAISFSPEINDEPELWQFWQIYLKDAHKVALAIKSNKIKQSFSIFLRKIVPLVNFWDIHYPIKSITNNR